jgi:hypothetical protein
MGRGKRDADHYAEHGAMLAELERMQNTLAELARAVADLRAALFAEAGPSASSSTDEREAS